MLISAHGRLLVRETQEESQQPATNQQKRKIQSQLHIYELVITSKL